MQRIILVATAVAAAVVCAMIGVGTRAALKPDSVITLADFPEASGLAFWPEAGTIVAVSDARIVAEISLDGRILRRRNLEGYDLEGVVIEPGGTSALAVDETGSRLLRIALADFTIQRARDLPVISPAPGRNRYFEGVTLDLEADEIVLAHESHPAAIVRLRADSLEIASVHVLSAAMVTAVVSTDLPGERCVLARDAGLAFVDRSGVRTSGWLPLAGEDLEGIALVPGMGLVACSDTTPSRLLVFSRLDSWEAVRAAVRSVGSTK